MKKLFAKNVSFNPPLLCVAAGFAYLWLTTGLALESASPSAWGLACLNFVALGVQSYKQMKLRSYIVRLKQLVKCERAQGRKQANLVTLGRVAAEIAHEISNSVAAVQLAAEEIEYTLREPAACPPAAQHLLREIRKRADQSVRTIRAISSLSRLAEADPLEEVSLAHLIESALDLSRDKFHQRDTKLLAPPVPPSLKIRCRPTQIVQVLLNLIHNALDAAVESNDKWVKIEWDEKRNMIAVSDSGAGVPEHLKAKVFRSFFTTKNPGKGYGIGLGLSRRIMEGHGGTIELCQEQATTTFRLRFQEANYVER